tara:strand:- start:78 stop:509 length:432 start_codon:yes stop_codon:yes gene_type:complete
MDGIKELVDVSLRLYDDDPSIEMEFRGPNLKVRRDLLERIGEISVQSAHADQYEAEALKEEQRAAEARANPQFGEVYAEVHVQKANLLRRNADYSLERAKQARQELEFIRDRGVIIQQGEEIVRLGVVNGKHVSTRNIAEFGK